jgi:hypothetical protein
MFPSTTSISSQLGFLDNPGIVIISPNNTVIIPAPLYNWTSRTVTSKSLGTPNFLGSSDNEYWVFATQIGRLARPFFLISSIFSFASLLKVTFLAP